ncbi:MAG: response regulator [Cucumibacter sp.]
MGELKSVLCVDDDKDILEVARMTLEVVADFDVTTCSNGLAAIELAREINPDLILLDVMMPGIDGPMTLKRIQSDPKITSIPVVMITARVQHHEISKYFDIGAAGVIPKPFDPMTLHLELKAIWKDWQVPETI